MTIPLGPRRLQAIHSHLTKRPPSAARRQETADFETRQQFSGDGVLLPQAKAEFEREGFLVLRGIVAGAEILELRHEVARILERAPAAKGSATDACGRPAICEPGQFQFAAPGRATMNREHEWKLRRAAPVEGVQEHVVKISNWMRFSEPGARLYAHPKLLAAAASVNGANFVPFSESLIIKHPGFGAALAWHQDGGTHWDDGSSAEHGFNFMVNLYDNTAQNALWVLPRSHRCGPLDISGLMDHSDGSLPGAVPLLCKAGEVAMVNRNLGHGSFANTSDKPRHTWIFGFHKRSAVDGVHSNEQIELRRRMIPLAVDCRALRWPREQGARFGTPLLAGGGWSQERWRPECPQVRAVLEAASLSL